MEFKGIIFFTFIMFYLFFSYNGFAQTQRAMNYESNNEFLKIDKELNDTYKEILVIYNKDTLFIKKLKVAQKAWILFRDAHLSSIFPAEDLALEYGSMYHMCYSEELGTITKERIKELKVWLDGYDESEGCNGSVKSKYELSKIKKSLKR
jgi:uncharacterized protein YecT (DUF1311 family)